MKRSVVATCVVVGLWLTVAGQAGAAAIRMGTQANTSGAENGGTPSTTITSVTAKFAPDTGQFDMTVTFAAPASTNMFVYAVYNSDPSGQCTRTLDDTSVGYIPSSGGTPTYAALSSPDGKGSAAGDTTGANVRISGQADSMKGLDYRCVTVTAEDSTGGTELSRLTPSLYFTGFGPPAPLAPTPAPASKPTPAPAPLVPDVTPKAPCSGLHGKKLKKCRTAQRRKKAVKKCKKLHKGTKRAACLGRAHKIR